MSIPMNMDDALPCGTEATGAAYVAAGVGAPPRDMPANLSPAEATAGDETATG